MRGRESEYDQIYNTQCTVFGKDFLKIRAQENNFEKTQDSKAVNMIYFFNCTLSVIYKSKTVVSSTESIRS